MSPCRCKPRCCGQPIASAGLVPTKTSEFAAFCRPGSIAHGQGFDDAAEFDRRSVVDQFMIGCCAGRQAELNTNAVGAFGPPACTSPAIMGECPVRLSIPAVLVAKNELAHRPETGSDVLEN